MMVLISHAVEEDCGKPDVNEKAWVYPESRDDWWPNEIYLGWVLGIKHGQGSLCDLTDFTLTQVWLEFVAVFMSNDK